MTGENEDLRIKMELMNDDEDTCHLYDSESSEDVKPTNLPRITPRVTACIDLSSDDDDGPARPARKKRKRSSFFIRLVVKEVATQTDAEAEKKDAGNSTDDVPKAEASVNTDEPPKTAEIGVSTDVITDEAADKDQENDENTNVDDGDPNQTPSSTKDIYYQCTICSCYYLSFNLLQKHSREHHNKAVSEQQKVSYGGNCEFCSASYVFNTYNKHIKSKHTAQFTKNGNIKKKMLVGPYECTICSMKFLSYNEGKRHRRVHDHIEKKTVLKKLKTPSEATTRKATPVKEEAKKHQGTPSHRAPIPKNVLFQCPKCELNFFTYRNGLRHRVACEKGENKKGIEAKCTICEKKFLQVHIRSHNSQHEMTNVFHVQEVVHGIEHKIMYRCMKCKVCMQERSCRLHFQVGCDKFVGIPCTVCHLKVEKGFVSKHKDAHAHMGLTKEDIILVDICDF